LLILKPLHPPPGTTLSGTCNSAEGSRRIDEAENDTPPQPPPLLQVQPPSSLDFRFALTRASVRLPTNSRPYS
jgi:hypothetical protein